MHGHPVLSLAAAKDKIIVALDVPGISQARRLIDQLSGMVGCFKVGLELFCAAGPEIVALVKNSGSKVFLDLKFHDIPNTVSGAVASACGLGADMLTIHLCGGSEICEAALAGRAGSSTLILGVTVLTSLNDASLKEVGCPASVQEEVLLLAGLAKKAGIRGLVSSAKELAALRERHGAWFTTVVPGIRPAWAAADDQKRLLTPAQAVNAGADYLVIGRPITRASDPVGAAWRIVQELQSASDETSVSPHVAGEH